MRGDTLRHVLFLLIASLVVILLIHFAADVIRFVKILYDILQHGLNYILPGKGNLQIIRQLIAVVLTPLIITLIPGSIYWLFTRKQMPGFLALMWGSWLILITLITMR